MQHLLDVSALQDAYSTSRFEVYMRRNLAFETELLNHLIAALITSKEAMQKEFLRLCKTEYQKKNLFVPFWTFQSHWKNNRPMPAPYSWYLKLDGDIMSLEEIVRVTNVIQRLRLLLGQSFDVRVRSFTVQTSAAFDTVQTYVDILYFPETAITKASPPLPSPVTKSRVLRND
jgi:hypothetical protein